LHLRFLEWSKHRPQAQRRGVKEKFGGCEPTKQQGIFAFALFWIVTIDQSKTFKRKEKRNMLPSNTTGSPSEHAGVIHDVHVTDTQDIDASEMRAIKRDGQVVEFRSEKIESAMLSAFLEVLGAEVGNSVSVRSQIRQLRDEVIRVLYQRKISGGQMAIHIEEIQDVVEETMMRLGQPKVARAYVLYRERRAHLRSETEGAVKRSRITVVDDNGETRDLPFKTISDAVMQACNGLADVDPKRVVEQTLRDLYDGVNMKLVRKAMVLGARQFVEEEPNYSFVTSRLLLNDIRIEVLGRTVTQKEMARLYPSYFVDYIKKGIEAELLNAELGKFDLKVLGKALDASRDLGFQYMGLQTLYDRYFIHIEERRIELPQAFYMRVAMGLAIAEPKDREAKAIEFYNMLSSFQFMSSTPTLFNSGTLHSQLSSCYLTTIADDLDGIYEGIKENALLSKFAGGLGNDWTSVRAMGSRIKGTNGQSQGVVPFLKVVNDTAVAVNQGGKRKGAVCAYLETWHMDIEEFLELRKNTGDDRRRTHDMNSANWIPDLFMRRVMEKAQWTLFSPSSFPELHELTGKAFEAAYVAAEAKADAGEIKHFKRIQATDLWRKMLTMLFETGHPWITFKDPCNLRSPQQHVGVVHSSNLCTEITLNTGPDEIAVCNLGSVNLSAHLIEVDGKVVIDHKKLRETVRVAMRMLDNVIDINFYPVKKAKTSNMRHRPVGLGIMSFQDCLYKMRVPYASKEAVEFADQSMEAVCYYAYEASSELAAERGRYESYEGSLWSQGILPLDSIEILARERGGYLEMDRSMTLDWDALRKKIAKDGMRNSNCVAIAPTATISDIIGVTASIEPTYTNLSVRSTLSGEFTQINEYLVEDLKKIGMWDKVMAADLKHFDGSMARITRVPEEIRALYQTAFEIDPSWLIEAASRRQKWIDQAQSLNIYVAVASGKKLDETYKLAWQRGLKTTYYLRAMGATNAEKSTGRGGELNAVPGAAPNLATIAAAASAAQAQAEADAEGAACMMRPGDPGFDQCEACQ
jgi:ribonucleoside-diphosphate reductase alpha chain